MNRLLLTLRFLATGSFFISTGDFIGVSSTAAYFIVIKVVYAIVGLKDQYIKMPSSPEERAQIRLKFYEMNHFPKVIGVIDCTHIRVLYPGECFCFSVYVFFKMCVRFPINNAKCHK